MIALRAFSLHKTQLKSPCGVILFYRIFGKNIDTPQGDFYTRFLRKIAPPMASILS
jgi:hypothetical protein